MYTATAIDNTTGDKFTFSADSIEALASQVKDSAEGHDFPGRLNIEDADGICCGWVKADGNWSWL